MYSFTARTTAPADTLIKLKSRHEIVELVVKEDSRKKIETQA